MSEEEAARWRSVGINEEVVARSVSRFQIAGGIGGRARNRCDHQRFGGRLRAPTPTAAAEFVVPELLELKNQTTQLTRRLIQSEQSVLDRMKERVKNQVNRAVFLDPKARLYQYTQRLDHLQTRLENAMQTSLENKKRDFSEAKFQLKACHPSQKLSKLSEQLALYDQRQPGPDASAVENRKTTLPSSTGPIGCTESR